MPHRQPQSPSRAVLVSFSSAGCCETGRYPPATFGVRVGPAHGEPRSGSNNSEREPTSVRSTNYGSEHLIRVFPDIGRIFSLLFLLSHPSTIGHPLRRRVQTRKRNMVSSKAKNGFNRVSCGTRRPGAQERFNSPARRRTARPWPTSRCRPRSFGRSPPASRAARHRRGWRCAP